MSAHDVIPVKLDDFRNTLIRCVSMLLLSLLLGYCHTRGLWATPQAAEVLMRVSVAG